MIVAECPAIPGCVSQGWTEAEALDNIREAIAGCLAARAAHGCRQQLKCAKSRFKWHLCPSFQGSGQSGRSRGPGGSKTVAAFTYPRVRDVGGPIRSAALNGAATIYRSDRSLDFYRKAICAEPNAYPTSFTLISSAAGPYGDQLRAEPPRRILDTSSLLSPFSVTRKSTISRTAILVAIASSSFAPRPGEVLVFAHHELKGPNERRLHRLAPHARRRLRTARLSRAPASLPSSRITFERE
jgi:hypothetical protein